MKNRFIYKTIFFLILGCMIAPHFAHADILTSLSGWWKANEGSGTSLTDSSGNSNTMTTHNSPTWTTPGKLYTNTLNFTNANKSYAISANNMPQNTSFTWAAWAYPTSFDASVNAIISGDGASYLYADGSGVLNYEDRTPNQHNTGVTLSLNTWVHVAVTCTYVAGGTNVITVYMNGSQVLQDSTVSSGCQNNFNQHVVIGGWGPNLAASLGWTGYIQDARVYDRVLSSNDIAELYAYPGHTIFLTATTTTTWTVPSDWNSSNNSIEVIGGGGGGGGVTSGTGGGGGAYSKATNVTLTPGATVTINVGAGGAGISTAGTASSGGDTYFCNSTSNCASIAGSAVVAGAHGGGGGISGYALISGGAGGSTTGGVGSTKYAGGSGGNGNNGYAATGGGGAAGPNGAGGNGGDSNTISNEGAPGGGGNGGGTNGSSTSGSTNLAGGNGGDNSGGTGHGLGGADVTDGTAGTNGGGGGGGGHAAHGGAGSTGTEWDSVHGSGSGPGGEGYGGGNGKNGALYGAGGAGASFGGSALGGNGAQGIIVIIYTPGGGGSTPATFKSFVNKLGSLFRVKFGSTFRTH